MLAVYARLLVSLCDAQVSGRSLVELLAQDEEGEEEVLCAACVAVWSMWSYEWLCVRAGCVWLCVAVCGYVDHTLDLITAATGGAIARFPFGEPH